ncbi:MAG: tRNA pseudouridine synthase A [Syntrophaceae bacterium PtaB.Bin038]|nr:MAG: tRNA pseudouridine synthase A [Syntrophaceae bacterium PtaB.Bin038]
MKRNIKLVIEYDGTAYNGWQRQADVLTIQQVMEDTIARIVSERVVLVASSRTDTGVHALNQVANFRTSSGLPLRNLHLGVNSLLPPDIVVKEMSDVDWEFHSRYHALGKVYRYRIFNRPVRTALERDRCWHVRRPLDLEAMRRAARHILGTHDFNSFCAAQCGVEDRVRTVTDARFEREEGGMIAFQIEADGFLRHMVRNIVGTLVDIGTGSIPEGDMTRIVEAKDRRQAGRAAPAGGLFLVEVRYG